MYRKNIKPTLFNIGLYNIQNISFTFQDFVLGKGEEKLFKNIQNQQSNKHNLKPDILHDQINHNVQYNNGKDIIIKLVIKTILSVLLCASMFCNNNNEKYQLSQIDTEYRFNKGSAQSSNLSLLL